jgi:Transposase DDE domain group 1
MAHPTGKSESDVVRLDFNRRLTLQFRGCVVTSDAGLLAYCELDDALGLTEMAGETLADARTGRNGRHALVGLLRQSVFGRLAGYEDVNDAERLRHDPAIRWIVGGKAAHSNAASPSHMGRFETQWLAAPANLSALADLSAQWIELVHSRRPPRGIVLDMDSSVSPTHGEQEMSVWNGHYACACFGLPEPLVGIHTSRQSCCKAAKARIFTPVRESSGESRFKKKPPRARRGQGSQCWRCGTITRRRSASRRSPSSKHYTLVMLNSHCS